MVYRYSVIERRSGAEERCLFATCKEAWEGHDPYFVAVFRDAQEIREARTVECYRYDLEDLKDALRFSVKDPKSLRDQVRAFLKAYLS